MRCDKCKYLTNTNSQCPFGYEQTSKEFLDRNCEKFVDKYKEEYTPIIAREIFTDIKKLLDFHSHTQFFQGEICPTSYFEKDLEGSIAELKKKYIGE